MSRNYEMAVEISGHSPEKELNIRKAAEKEWPFEDWWAGAEPNEGQERPLLNSSAEGTLCGGESEEEFTERLSRAVWMANGAYCTVIVNATFLENLPYEVHSLDEQDYAQLMKKEEESHGERA